MPFAKETGEMSLPENHVYFMFVGERHDPGNTLTILVAVGRMTKMLMVTVVFSKSTVSFFTHRVMAYLAEIGRVSNEIDETKPRARDHGFD